MVGLLSSKVFNVTKEEIMSFCHKKVSKGPIFCQPVLPSFGFEKEHLESWKGSREVGRSIQASNMPGWVSSRSSAL